MSDVTTIAVGRGFSVNCYLVRGADGFVLVDSGVAAGRGKLRAALAEAGCEPGDLRLLAITHGDPDHVGNAKWVRDTYGAPLAMSAADAPMAETGDMLASRTGTRLGRILLGALKMVGMTLADDSRFTPDVTLAEGDSLVGHGLDARVYELPGHSRGSIAILTADGDLFCGDILASGRKGPALGPIVDDRAARDASVARLCELPVVTVCPGQGPAFPMSAFRWPEQEGSR
jgi:hydroxyacylglutathione hydrolase